MLIGHDRIRLLIPHAGSMCLLAGVTQYDSRRIVCVATSHRDPANPLAREGRLAAICAVEYAGQAIALHGSLNGPQPSRAGYLSAVREVRCLRAFLHDCSGDLTIEAQLVLGERDRVVYEFSLRTGADLLVAGRAAVALKAGG